MCDKPRVNLGSFDNRWYDPGAGCIRRLAWFCVNAIVLQCPLNPFSSVKVLALRLFGAKIGSGVVIKPAVNVKYPWRLKIGDRVWIGERVWLDNLDTIEVGSDCCISQGAYLCTGNHDWSDAAFGLIVKPIVVEDGAWIGARATVLPGVTIRTHSVAGAGAVISHDTEPYTIWQGNPAIMVKQRQIKGESTAEIAEDAEKRVY